MSATGLTQRLPAIGLADGVPGPGLSRRLGCVSAAGLTRPVTAARLTQRLPAAGLSGVARFYASCGSWTYGCGPSLVVVGFAITQLFVFGHRNRPP